MAGTAVQHPVRTWVSRVPSPSNLADVPSRAGELPSRWESTLVSPAEALDRVLGEGGWSVRESG
eukprot:762438-Amphidinium_carterae.1